MDKRILLNQYEDGDIIIEGVQFEESERWLNLMTIDVGKLTEKAKTKGPILKLVLRPEILK